MTDVLDMFDNMEHLLVLIDEVREQCLGVYEDGFVPEDIRHASKVAFNRMNVADYEVRSSVDLLGQMVNGFERIDLREQPSLF